MLFKRWFLRKEVVTDISHFEVQGVYLAKKLLGGGGEEKRKLCEKNDFEKKKKKPGLKFNPDRLPNSWALSISILTLRWTTVSDKNSSDTLTKRCFFPSRAPLVPLKVVYRGSVTKSCTPTSRGQGDPKVSQPC